MLKAPHVKSDGQTNQMERKLTQMKGGQKHEADTAQEKKQNSPALIGGNENKQIYLLCKNHQGFGHE